MMKRLMISIVLLAAMLPMWAQTAQVNKTWYNYDMRMSDGSNGYVFHVSFDVSGKQYGNVLVQVWFFDYYGNFVQAASSAPSSYKSADGSCYGGVSVVPNYANTTWGDLEIAIPYSVFNMKRGDIYYYRAFIRDADNNGNTLANSDPVYLDEMMETANASVDSIMVNKNVTKNGKKGVSFRYNLNVKGSPGQSYEVLMQLLDDNYEALPGRHEDYMSTSGTFIAYIEDYKPSYMNAIWRNCEMFIPEEALPIMNSGKNYYYQMYVRLSSESDVMYASSIEDIHLVNEKGGGNDDTDDHGGNDKVQSKPTITWLSPTTTQNQKQYTVKAGVKSSSKIEDVSITVNGQIFRGFKAVNNDGYDFNVNQEITLAEGNNEIVLAVKNASGTSTHTVSVKYQHKQVDTEDGGVTTTQRRLALVIGNSNYVNGKLANPVNDATDVAAKLRDVGFEVILLTDGTKRSMEEKINEFGQKASSYDVCLFYYAGHGIQINGENYLVPVDVSELSSPSDVQYDCTNAGRVLAKMEESNCKTNIVVLDACRNNPVSRGWRAAGDGGGLSAMNAPQGSIIAYSTAPGSVALDGKGRNSPYTTAFLQALDRPGLEILSFFKYVSKLVGESTNKGQTPWCGSSLSDDFYFRPE